MFGYNAPQYELLPESLRDNTHDRQGNPIGIYASQNDYADGNLPASPKEINLDTVYPQIVAGSWIVLVKPDYAECYGVELAAEEALAEYTIAAKSTRLELSGENLDEFSPRTTTVYAQSEELPLAEYPIAANVAGGEVTLDRAVEGLEKGRTVLVSGTTTEGAHAVEAMVLASASTSTDDLTTLRFDGDLEDDYLSESVTIHANVAPATHGERREEVLGSGDASVPYQRFTLRESPITYVRSTAPGGTESTLQVRVNDMLWHEVPSLYGLGPNDRVYTTRRDDGGKTTIQFGDGHTGARPPTGQENVRAVYRKGIGLEGKVRADQLTLPLTRPLGVRSVTNALAATDAADPEPREEVRRNAPLTVLTLDRVVSLQDHEDFASAYAGISKALANWVRDSETRGVFVTVAGPGGSLPSNDLISDLLSAMREAGDPFHPLFVESFRPVLFDVEANVRVDADLLPERVLAAVETMLRARFSFGARSFGQSVALSEVVAVVQGVPGVVAVDVNAFDFEVDDAIIGENLDGIITSWDEGAERVYGYSSEEALGRPISLLVPFGRSDEIPAVLESIRRGQKVVDYETVFVTKDGRSLDVSLMISPIENSAGTIVGAATTARVRREPKLRLDAGGPQVGVGGAELLTLNPAPLSLGVMS